jgi:heat shock protein HslJ
MTKRIDIIIMLFCIALGVQGCGGNDTGTKAQKGDDEAKRSDTSITLESFYGTEWRLTQIEIEPEHTKGMAKLIPDDQEFTLTFTDKHTVTGMADCKGYGYSFETGTDGTIRFFDPAPQVMMHCGDDSFDAEFYKHLQNAQEYEVTEKALRITCSGDSDTRYYTLVFTRDPATGSGKPVELVEFALFDPGPSDPFTVAASRIVGDELRLTVQYGGGCADHEFALIGPLTLEGDDPTPVTLYLHHNANGDMCKAYITKEITFDLRPLRKRWMEVTGRSNGTMALSIGDLHTSGSTTLDYVVGE